MRFVVMDLEWNGAYCRQTRGYFNEIIEIGAVRLDGGLRPDGEFHAVIRPQVSSELSSIVRDLTSITPEELEELLPTLDSGMIPKMTACLDAIRNGAKAAHVIDGRVPHSVILELMTEGGIGTMISAESYEH
mgnify:CR=1 FL=1